jgi:ribosomal protein S18 acetylase RimI-like enzyme
MPESLRSQLAMIDPDRSIRSRFTHLTRGAFTLREVEAADGDFLYTLFCAVQAEAIRRAGGDPNTLAGAGPLCALQFASQSQGYASVFPNAAHYLALERATGALVGRIMIDWGDLERPAIGVDVSVLPNARRGAVGLHLLRAWVHTCDVLGRAARLQVMPDNPARALYRRLGFVESDATSFPLTMTRRPATAHVPDRTSG